MSKVEMSISFGPRRTRIRLIYPSGLVEFFDLWANFNEVSDDWQKGCTSRETKKEAKEAVLEYNKILSAKYLKIGYL